MKLRNKKTGEIVEVESLYLTQTQELYLNYINEEKKQKVYMTDKIASFNLDWEDYEEPKEYWCVREDGVVEKRPYPIVIECFEQENRDAMREIGNYFETKEEAEKAVEKLKAWKRLKDKGFRPKMWEWEYICPDNMSGELTVKAHIDDATDSDGKYTKDLDLLFGGEE